MGVVLFSLKDCLQDGFSRHRNLISPPCGNPRRIPGNQTLNGNRYGGGRRKQNRSPFGSPPPPPLPPSSKRAVNDGNAYRAKSPGLVMGEVRILRRGEDISPSVAQRNLNQQQPKQRTTPFKHPEPKREALVEVQNGFLLSSTNPKPELTPSLNPVMKGFYAGSGFSISPPPSSVPLPAFFTKKVAADEVAVDLRRILRLE